MSRILLALFACIALIAAGCGGSDDDGSSSTTSSNPAKGNGTDAAFVQAMVEHHRGALDMATLALDRAEHEELRELAERIIEAQQIEVRAMKRIGQELDAAEAEPGSLGTDDHGEMADVEALRTAKPFDRAFIDAMVPHHQDAIAMARVQLEQGERPDLRRLAQSITDAQKREVAQMQQWRADWYGGPGPADAGTEHGHGN